MKNETEDEAICRILSITKSSVSNDDKETVMTNEDIDALVHYLLTTPHDEFPEVIEDKRLFKIYDEMLTEEDFDKFPL